MTLYKKYLIRIAFLFCLAFFLILSMNYIVDPYGYKARDGKFIKNLTMFNKPHVTKARINSEGYYFLIGSSRMARVDPNVIERLTGKEAHNIKLDGATLEENTLIASKVKERGNFFIYSFDAFSFNKNREKSIEIGNRLEAYREELDRNFVFNKYFNGDITIRSLQHLIKKLRVENLAKQYIKEDLRNVGFSLNKTLEESGILNNLDKANFSNFEPYSDESITNLARLGTNRDIFIIFPKYVSFYSLFAKYQDIEKKYFSGIRTLVKNTDAQVWLFYGANDLTNNIDNFIDNGWHFKPKLSNIIFDEVFNFNSKSLQDMQGVLVTKENLDQHLSKISNEISAFSTGDK